MGQVLWAELTHYPVFDLSITLRRKDGEEFGSLPPHQYLLVATEGERRIDGVPIASRSQVKHRLCRRETNIPTRNHSNQIKLIQVMSGDWFSCSCAGESIIEGLGFRHIPRLVPSVVQEGLGPSPPPISRRSGTEHLHRG